MVMVAACGSSQRTTSPKKEVATDSTLPVEQGKRAPAFTKRALDGQTVAIPSANKPTVIVFAATWSSPDLQLLRFMSELAHGYPDLQVVVISVDDEPRDVEKVFRENGGVTSFPIVWDEGHTMAERYRPSSVPSTYVFDDKGVLQSIFAGYHENMTTELDHSIAKVTHKDEARVAARKKDNETRAETARTNALATCRKKKPIRRESECAAACHTDEMNAAYHACRRAAGSNKPQDDECLEACEYNCQKTCTVTAATSSPLAR